MIKRILKLLRPFNLPIYKVGRIIATGPKESDFGTITGYHWDKYDERWIYEVDGHYSDYTEKTVSKYIKEYGDLGCL